MAVKMLFDLKAGDRFYFVGDPKKQVREIGVVVMKRKYYGETKTAYVIYSDLKEGHSNREVVFLRNSKETK